MKRGFNKFSPVDENIKAKHKHQNLLNDFLELQKEFVSKKKKLQATKQRRDIILAEIQFLKQRRSYLLQSQSSNIDLRSNIIHMKRLKTERKVPDRERLVSDYDAAVGTTHLAIGSKSSSRYEELGNNSTEVLAGKEALRLECMSKNYFIDDKRLGKRNSLGMVK